MKEAKGQMVTTRFYSNTEQKNIFVNRLWFIVSIVILVDVVNSKRFIHSVNYAR